MTQLAKVETKAEAQRQMYVVDKVLGDLITKYQDLDDRAKVLKRKIRESKEAQELKEIARVKKQLTIERYEAIGQRKFIVRFLEKLGVKLPETKLTKLALTNGDAKELVGS